jgi:ParB family chromosome partitioning protein
VPIFNDPLNWISENKKDLFGVLSLNLKDVKPDETQPRKSFEDIETLAASIKKHGLIHPILVRKESGKYIVISGQRRYLAFKFLGIQEIPAIEWSPRMDDILPIQLIENIQRKDLSPLELAVSLKKMKDKGLTVRQIADVIGMSRSSVQDNLSLLQIKEPELKEKINESPTKALLVSRVKDKKEKKNLIEKFEEVRTEKIRQNKNIFNLDKTFGLDFSKQKDVAEFKAKMEKIVDEMKSSLSKAGNINISLKINIKK